MGTCVRAQTLETYFADKGEIYISKSISHGGNTHDNNFKSVMLSVQAILT